MCLSAFRHADRSIAPVKRAVLALRGFGSESRSRLSSFARFQRDRRPIVVPSLPPSLPATKSAFVQITSSEYRVCSCRREACRQLSRRVNLARRINGNRSNTSPDDTAAEKRQTRERTNERIVCSADDRSLSPLRSDSLATFTRGNEDTRRRNVRVRGGGCKETR